MHDASFIVQKTSVYTILKYINLKINNLSSKRSIGDLSKKSKTLF